MLASRSSTAMPHLRTARHRPARADRSRWKPPRSRSRPSNRLFVQRRAYLANRFSRRRTTSPYRPLSLDAQAPSPRRISRPPSARWRGNPANWRNKTRRAGRERPRSSRVLRMGRTTGRTVDRATDRGTRRLMASTGCARRRWRSSRRRSYKVRCRKEDLCTARLRSLMALRERGRGVRGD